MFNNGFPKEWSTLRKLAWLYRTVINAVSAVVKTIIGNPIHITDALAKPVQALSIALEPIQDLHGYEYPWPAGGGKNKLNPKLYAGGSYNPTVGATFNLTESATQFTTTDNKIFSLTTSATWRYFTILIPCAGIDVARFSYQFSSTGQGGRSWGYLDDNYTVLSATNSTDASASYDAQWNPSSLEGAAYVYIVLSNRGTASATLTLTEPQFELGSIKTSFAPFSNICPIYGHTDADVVRTGKNLCDSAAFESGLLATAIGSDINAVTSTTRYSHSGIMPAKSALAVTVKTLDLSKIDYASIVAYVGDKVAWTAAQSFSSSVMSKIWTIPANTYEKLRINIGAPTGVTADASNAEIQVGIGSTASDFAPYVGTTYPIPLGQTVYGGTLDVVTGVATVDRAIVDGGDLTWTKVSGNNYRNFYANLSAPLYIKSRPTIISSQYRPECNDTAPGTGDNYCWIRSDFTLSVKDLSKDALTGAEFQTAMTGVQFVYELKNPTTIQLTPQQVELLLGENNIWSDGTMTLVYLADGNASDVEALNILLGNRYVNNHGADEPTDREALDILLGGNTR